MRWPEPSHPRSAGQKPDAGRRPRRAAALRPASHGRRRAGDPYPHWGKSV